MKFEVVNNKAMPSEPWNQESGSLMSIYTVDQHYY